MLGVSGISAGLGGIIAGIKLALPSLIVGGGVLLVESTCMVVAMLARQTWRSVVYWNIGIVVLVVFLAEFVLPHPQ